MKMYVLHVKSGYEISAYQELKKRGFDVLLPMKKEYIRKNGKWELREKIIFTQYLFIICDLTDKKTYYEIRKADGVIRFLGNENGKSFQCLYPCEQEYIKWLWNGGKPIEPSKIYVTMYGDKIVMSGTLRNYSGDEIDYNIRQRKASVYITIAGKKHKVTLPIICI